MTCVATVSVIKLKSDDDSYSKVESIVVRCKDDGSESEFTYEVFETGVHLSSTTSISFNHVKACEQLFRSVSSKVGFMIPERIY